MYKATSYLSSAIVRCRKISDFEIELYLDAPKNEYVLSLDYSIDFFSIDKLNQSVAFVMKDLMSFLPDVSVHLGEPLTEQLIGLINYDLLKSQIFFFRGCSLQFMVVHFFKTGRLLHV